MSRQVIKLGITGGIGSGKSITCKVLEVLKVPVYYADDRAKWLMNNDPYLIQSIIKLFGTDSYQKGTLNRPFIASRIFQDHELLEEMNALVHPVVNNDFKKWVEDQTEPIVAKEAALLFESGSYQQLDQTWLVTCPVDKRISRIKSRDPHRSTGEIQSIIQKQWTEERKLPLSDFVIVNDDRKLVIPQILKGIAKLTH